MNDVPRNRPRPEIPSPPDGAIDRDLQALDARSRRDMKPLAETLATLSGPRRKRTWEEGLMAWTGFWRSRPRWAVAGVVAVLALALLVVPVSYEQVTGHQVAVTVAGAQIERPVMDEIAAGLKTALGADAVEVALRAGDGGFEYTLRANLGAAEGAKARSVADVFARTLTEKGYDARADVTEIRERTSGNVYAMMMDNVIRVSVDGKSAAELETEIAAQLTAAGVPNAEVSVTMDGDDKMEIQISAEARGEPGEMDLTQPTQIVLTKGGEDLGGELEDIGVRIAMLCAEGGPEQMKVDVNQAGRSATAVVSNPQALTDAALAAEISRQLTEQGLVDLSVSVQDGQVEITGLDPKAGVLGAAEEKATWGDLKQKYQKSN